MADRIPRLPLKRLVANETINATDYFSPASDTRNLDRLRYIVIWDTGTTPDIDIQLQTPYNLPNDQKEEIMSQRLDNGSLRIDSHTDWATLDIATVNPNISGASGNHIIDVIEIPNRFVRLKFTYNSGTADIDIYAEGKGE